MVMRVNVSDPKTGKSYKKELTDDAALSLIGKKLGDKVNGAFAGLDDYEFEISGGCDNAGFVMRKDVQGVRRVRVLVSKGPGFFPKRKGFRTRKTFKGSTIDEDVALVNLKITKQGSKKLEDVFPKTEKKEGEQKEAKK